MSNTPPWNINQPPMMAYIREDECIGCTKCIPDCPTDAIMGAAKMMHTVITDACTGCQLCVPTCPVDCIEIRPASERSEQQKKELDKMWLKRFDQHNQRAERDKKELQDKHAKAALCNELDSVEARKQYIQQVLARTKRRE